MRFLGANPEREVIVQLTAQEWKLLSDLITSSRSGEDWDFLGDFGYLPSSSVTNMEPVLLAVSHWVEAREWVSRFREMVNRFEKKLMACEEPKPGDDTAPTEGD